MRIGLLGHGIVGSGVSGIIDAGRTPQVAGLHVARILVRDAAGQDDPRLTADFAVIAADPSIDVVVECMGGIHPAYEYVKASLAAGRPVVTSNKKMLACCYRDLMETARAAGVALMYEASVGGGIPWIAHLTALRRVDEVTSFRGILNGTTNYILDRMTAQGQAFGPMLTQAQQLGYAESDPSEDIDGDDVRYKCFLSAAAAFGAGGPLESIPAYGIRSISAQDIAYAARRGRTIKLVGHGTDRPTGLGLYVMPAMLKDDDMLSHVPLNYNGMETVSTTLGRTGLMGQGAGAQPTAHAMVQDVLAIAAGARPQPALTVKPIANDVTASRFYLRTRAAARLKGIMDEGIDDESFISRPLTLDGLRTAIAGIDDGRMFVAEVEA